MNTRYICIHGHFYQPPREHAWLEVVETQDSAYPFHDWNERINFECYAQNSAARILDEQSRIRKIVNNYTRISFNFGPTLLHWMEQNDPSAYKAILKADKKSKKIFGGHGSAIAQVYSHLIMPLANLKDKRTQVIWGIRDFEHRFKRLPEGMWLAETAVCLETLEVLAKEGIKFTILAPRQAKAVKKLGADNWSSVDAGSIDTRRPYRINLPSGNKIDVFFYNGSISQDVAFKGLLNSGRHFADQLLSGFDPVSKEPQLVHIATDGESYGHHHQNGEMALASCIEHIIENDWADLCNYGLYLEKFPPEYEAKIHENSSWSCVHGVERWKSDCGCCSGGNSGWNQRWRAPLREALDWLRDEVAVIFEKEGNKYLKDTIDARNGYIEILLNRDSQVIDQYFEKYGIKNLTSDQKTTALRLLELQRNALLMYTSCGWFFDEISGIETVQILQYACRVIYYAKQVANRDLEDAFIALLEKAPSNIEVYANGGMIYKEEVLPSRVDLSRVGMHYAISSLFEAYPEKIRLFNYLATSDFFRRFEAGNYILAFGRTNVESRITLSEKHFSFIVLYLGQHNFIGYISRDMDLESFNVMYERIRIEWEQSHLGEIISLMPVFFGDERFTVHSLFHDEKRKVIDLILENSMRKVEEDYREIYNGNYQLMNASRQAGLGIPEAFKTTLKFLLRKDLNRYFEEERLSIEDLNKLIREFKKWEVPVGKKRSFLLTASERLFKEVASLSGSEKDLPKVKLLNSIFKDLKALNVNLDTWKSENAYFSLLKKVEKGKVSNDNRLVEEYRKLGKTLNFRTEIFTNVT
ncbi:MAG: DUF3536 domain-containing protein [Bacteroidota bacterium]